MLIVCSMRPLVASSAVDLAHLSCGNVQSHAHITNKSHANSNSPHISEFDVCYNLKPLNVKLNCGLGSKVRRNHSALPADYKTCAHKVPDTKKLLTERKFKLNRSNPSIAELGRCSSDSPLRRSAPVLDINPRRVSSPLLGGGGLGCRGGRGAVLLPARAPSLPMASAWCCGSFVKQLRKTHHFD